MSLFSQILTNALRERGYPAPKLERKGRKTYYKTGFDLDVAYDIVPLAVQHGHKVYIDQSSPPFETTVGIRIYASRGEVFYLKAYASNANQAEAAVEELLIIAGPSTHLTQGALL